MNIQETINEVNQAPNLLWSEAIGLLEEAIRHPDDEGWKLLAQEDDPIRFIQDEMGNNDVPGDWFEFAENTDWSYWKHPISSDFSPTAYFELNGLEVECKIKGTRSAYGHTDYLITPVSGEGETWKRKE